MLAEFVDSQMTEEKREMFLNTMPLRGFSQPLDIAKADIVSGLRRGILDYRNLYGNGRRTLHLNADKRQVSRPITLPSKRPMGHHEWSIWTSARAAREITGKI